MNEKKQIKVVIGANFGDEGKGLMTDYFCHELTKQGRNVLDIRYNGGANAAHNVITPDGQHHTFSHFGAGSFNEETATYLAEDFILNPILFCRELEELRKIGLEPKVYVHAWCRVTTPYDMILNQMIEKRRGAHRHGSCGVGINETIQRYEKISSTNILFGDINGLTSDCLKTMRHYYVTKRLRELNIFDITEEEFNQLNSPLIIENYLTQLHQMGNYCTLADSTSMDMYDGIVFEGAQGLLLDQDYLPFAPHLTSSKTGSFTPKKILLESGLQNEDIEFCYVTRSYFTRHGAGPVPTECTSAEIFGGERIEPYNHENEFQGKFRYGYFDRELFDSAVAHDSTCMLYGFPYAETSVAITHLDTTGNKIILPRDEMRPELLQCAKYYSYGETRYYVITI